MVEGREICLLAQLSSSQCAKSDEGLWCWLLPLADPKSSPNQYGDVLNHRKLRPVYQEGTRRLVTRHGSEYHAGSHLISVAVWEIGEVWRVIVPLYSRRMLCSRQETVVRGGSSWWSITRHRGKKRGFTKLLKTTGQVLVCAQSVTRYQG